MRGRLEETTTTTTTKKVVVVVVGGVGIFVVDVVVGVVVREVVRIWMKG